MKRPPCWWRPPTHMAWLGPRLEVPTSHGGTPSHHPYFFVGFSMINQPFLGYPQFYVTFISKNWHTQSMLAWWLLPVKPCLGFVPLSRLMPPAISCHVWLPEGISGMSVTSPFPLATFSIWLGMFLWWLHAPKSYSIWNPVFAGFAPVKSYFSCETSISADMISANFWLVNSQLLQVKCMFYWWNPQNVLAQPLDICIYIYKYTHTYV